MEQWATRIIGVSKNIYSVQLDLLAVKYSANWSKFIVDVSLIWRELVKNTYNGNRIEMAIFKFDQLMKFAKPLN